MKDLLSAIRTYYETATGSGGAGLLSSIGALSFKEAPATTTLPLVVYTVINAPRTQMYGSAGYSEPQIDFKVWGKDSEDSLTLVELLCTKFDDHLFTLSGSVNFFARRIGDPIPTPDVMLDERGNPVDGWLVSYAYAKN